MPCVTHQEGRVDYTATGDGPGLVLIHGTAGDAASNWQAVTAALAERFTIVAPELPVGQLGRRGEPPSLSSTADAVGAAADDAGLERYHLVGYSLGAAVAAQLAADRADRIGSLLMIAGWIRTDPALAFALDLWRRLFDADRELFVRFVLQAGMSNGFFERLDEDRLAEAVAVFVSLVPAGTPGHIDLDMAVDLTDDLSRIEAPTRVIGLSDDRVVPPRHARALAEAIDGAEYVEIPSGHLVPWERPDLFLEALLDHLDRFATIRQIR